MFQLIPKGEVYAANRYGMKWLSDRTLTNSLTEVASADNNSILLRWDAKETGTYKVDFYVPDTDVYDTYNEAHPDSPIRGNVAKYVIEIKRGISQDPTTAGIQSLIYNHKIY